MVCPAPLLPHESRSAYCRRADGKAAAVSHSQQYTFSCPQLQPPDVPWRWAKRPSDLDLRPFDLESGVWFTTYSILTGQPNVNTTPLKQPCCTFMIISKIPSAHRNYPVSVFLTSMLHLIPLTMTFWLLAWLLGLESMV